MPDLRFSLLAYKLTMTTSNHPGVCLPLAQASPSGSCVSANALCTAPDFLDLLQDAATYKNHDCQERDSTLVTSEAKCNKYLCSSKL